MCLKLGAIPAIQKRWTTLDYMISANHTAIGRSNQNVPGTSLKNLVRNPQFPSAINQNPNIVEYPWPRWILPTYAISVAEIDFQNATSVL